MYNSIYRYRYIIFCFVCSFVVCRRYWLLHLVSNKWQQSYNRFGLLLIFFLVRCLFTRVLALFYIFFFVFVFVSVFCCCRLSVTCNMCTYVVKIVQYRNVCTRYMIPRVCCCCFFFVWLAV